MKFSSTVFTLGLAVSSVVAEPIARRDIDTFETVISDIGDGTDKLDKKVKAFKGDGDDVENESEKLISTIKKGVKTVKGEDDLDSSGALELTGPVKKLTKKVETLVDDVIDKKKDFVSADLGGKMKKNLNQQYDAAKSLADAISDKVPDSLSDIADKLSSGITDAIQKGIDEYKDVKDGGGDKPTSTGGGSEPTSTGGDEEPTSTGGGEEPTSTGGGGGGGEEPTEAPTSAPGTSSLFFLCFIKSEHPS